MCDGACDETTWTIKLRATGTPLETASGYGYSFSDEAEARGFVQARPDGAALEVVAVPVSEP